jgi:hypothetical protein
MQRVSEGELVVFCGAAARPQGGRAHPPLHIKKALASKRYYKPSEAWPIGERTADSVRREAPASQPRSDGGQPNVFRFL